MGLSDPDDKIQGALQDAENHLRAAIRGAQALLYTLQEKLQHHRDALPDGEVKQMEAEIAITSRFISFTSLTLSNRPDDLVQRRTHLVAAMEALNYLQEGIKPQQ